MMSEHVGLVVFIAHPFQRQGGADVVFAVAADEGAAFFAAVALAEVPRKLFGTLERRFSRAVQTPRP